MKNILLAVTGLNPQVITEALYGLLHEGREVHAVHVITTRLGKEQIFTHLLAPSGGRFHSFCREYGLDPGEIDFSAANVHVMKNEAGVEIDDILEEDDNEVLLQMCLELTFRFTRDHGNAVFFLVAGGRKTMTSCLTLAAQLYGRPQDRIYHVLVTSEFESCRDFWYPPKRSAPLELTDRRGQKYIKESRYAEIRLVSIPFVSVREMIDEKLLEAPQFPATLMLSLIREEKPLLRISVPEGKISYKGLELDLHPARLALYVFFAEQKKNCRHGLSCRSCTECFLEAAEVLAGQERIREIYNRIPGSRRVEEMSDTGIAALTVENFNVYKSRIRKDLRRAFGAAISCDLEISSTGSRPDTRYGIRLDRERIRLEW